MIERYTIHSNAEELSSRFDIEIDDYYLPSYNAAPTQKLPIIVNKAKNGISYLHWGTNTQWSNNKSISKKLVSAPVGDLLTKTILKSALQNKRCIIPVTGFYLWKQVSKKSKRPYYFKIDSLDIFGIAGIWEEFEDLDGNTNHTFKIITIKNELKEDGFGDELPLILNEASEKLWLSDAFSPNDTSEILSLKLETTFNYYIVSPHISDIKINNSNLILAQPPVDQLGNFTLFE